MARPQSAICTDTGAFGLFLTFVLESGGAAQARRAIAALPHLTAEMAAATGEPLLVGSVAIGAAAWPALMAGPLPPGLAPFEPLGAEGRLAPSTPADLFIHIHSPRHDANFALARALVARLGAAVRRVEEVHGFKHLGGRDLGGFVDGTENPKGDERAAVALVASGPFAGGSFVSVQRYVHALPKWEALTVAEQEGIIGRTKDTDEELPEDIRPPTAHIARVVIEEDGAELEILRHSLPYGCTAEHGLYFVAYGSSPGPFRRMLERMVLSDGDGHYDRLLDFSRPVTGAAFFAPSLEMLAG